MKLRSDLEDAVSRAGLLATTRGHASIAAEHLLCALLDDAQVAGALESAGVAVGELRRSAEALVGALDPRVCKPGFAPPVTAVDVLRRAFTEQPPGRAREVTPGAAFVALFGPPVSRATQLLIESRVSRDVVHGLLGRDSDVAAVPGLPPAIRRQSA